jgi:periplasmic protein TonB
MSATTINSFPAFHSYTSPRGWVLAIIVLLHAAMFWALSSGLSRSVIQIFKPPLIARDIPLDPRPTEPPKAPPDYRPTPTDHLPMPVAPPRAEFEEGETAPLITRELPPVDAGPGSATTPEPVIVEPRIDPRRGLSEPPYPPQEIRQQHEGTVLLSVLVLENGRVGEVRLDRSSGYARLDESALREARQWRLTPGTRDSKPVRMWKQIPITFQLKD